jgi:hypothetical protein
MHFHTYEKAWDPLTKPHKTTQNQNCKLQTSVIINFNKLPIYFSYDIQTISDAIVGKSMRKLKWKHFCNVCRIIPCRNESAMRQDGSRILLGNNTKWHHTTSNDVQMCWSLDFLVYTYTVDYTYTEFLLVPELKEL